MFEPLYTAEEARAAEEGHDVAELMERAGAAVAHEVLQRFPDARRIAVVCGGGANGGDGRIAARILREHGRDAVETTAVEQAGVIVDALFGTGFHGEPREEAAATIERINAAGAPVVSVDVPSGVDASTGEIAGAAVRATVTVTFHGRKVGLVVAPGLFHAGEVVVADIGLEPVETGRAARDTGDSRGRSAQAAGGQQVHGGIGSRGRRRARADRSGVPRRAGGLPCRRGLRRRRGARAVAPRRRGAAARGGQDHAGRTLWAPPRRPPPSRSARASAAPTRRRRCATELLAAGEQAIVLDADALHELEPGDWGPRAVLTPHAGELARLLGEDSAWVNAHRLEAVRRAAERFGGVCLLKGADTIVASPDAGVLVVAASAPGLATAGTGDVLTGIVAAFLAKGVEPRLAAAAAATAHGLAARSLPQAGLIASDVIAALPYVLQ